MSTSFVDHVLNRIPVLSRRRHLPRKVQPAGVQGRHDARHHQWSPEPSSPREATVILVSRREEEAQESGRRHHVLPHRRCLNPRNKQTRGTQGKTTVMLRVVSPCEPSRRSCHRSQHRPGPSAAHIRRVSLRRRRLHFRCKPPYRPLMRTPRRSSRPCLVVTLLELGCTHKHQDQYMCHCIGTYSSTHAQEPRSAHPSGNHDGHNFCLVGLDSSLQHCPNTIVIYSHASTSNRKRLHHSLSPYWCSHVGRAAAHTRHPSWPRRDRTPWLLQVGLHGIVEDKATLLQLHRSVLCGA